MADAASQERTEAPTDHKLRQARRRGEVPMSRDVNGAVGLLTTVAAIGYVIDRLVTHAVSATAARFSIAATQGKSGFFCVSILVGELEAIAAIVAPVFIAGFLAAVLGPLWQVGPMIAIDPIKPRLDRLNPVEGIRRIFFSLRTYLELSKSFFKVAAVSFVCGHVVYEHLMTIARLPSAEAVSIPVVMYSLIQTCVFRSAGVFVAIALFDFVYQRWQYQRDQRMSKDEVKREHKDQEGDPEHRQARKRLHEEIAQNNMLVEVPKADVVITNPTHIACALRFDPQEENSPRLLAMGQGRLAEKIKRIAEEMNIPTMENVSLARALRELDLNTEIPSELYGAVVQVLQWVEDVLEERGERPRWCRDEASFD